MREAGRGPNEAHGRSQLKKMSSAVSVRASKRRVDIPLDRGLLEKVTELLLLAGISSSELRSAVKHAESIANTRVPKSARSAPFDWWLYARVLSIWHRSAEFTDEDGVGRALPLVGKHSFRALVAKALPRSKPEVVLAALKALGAVRISGNRLVVPTSRSLIVRQRTQMTLLRAVDLCDALISTIHSNWLLSRSKTPERSVYERTVIAEKFDMRHLKAFDNLVRVHGQALLELLDAWLAEHEISGPGASRNEGRVGVEIFVFAKQVRQR